MRVRHKIMPGDHPGIDCGDTFADFLSTFGDRLAHEYIAVGVAEKFRQRLAKEKQKAGGKLTEEKISEICELSPADLLTLPKPKWEKAVKDIAGLSQEERTEALQALKKAVG